jgi:hypothetical protein
MVVYHGDISMDASFNPAMLSAILARSSSKARLTQPQNRLYDQLDYLMTFLDLFPILHSFLNLATSLFTDVEQTPRK